MSGSTFTAAQLAQIHDYNLPRYIFGVVAPVLQVAELAVLCHFAARLHRRVAVFLRRDEFGAIRWRERRGLRTLAGVLDRLWGDEGWEVAAAYGVTFCAILSALHLPQAVYFGLVWERRFGLSSYTNIGFAKDLLKGFFVESLAFAALSFGLFGLIRRTRHWWALLGIAGGLLLLISAAADPLRGRLYFERTPLPSGALRTELMSLLQNAQVDLQNVMVEDDSRATRKIDAGFLGQGPTRMLVLSDTLVARLAPDEVLAAVAHEAGHVHESRWLPRLGAAGALLAFLYLTDRLLRFLARTGKFGMTAPGDIRGLPAVFLMFVILSVLARPAAHAFSRQREAAADAYGLNLTQDPDAFVRLWIQSAHINKLDPAPPRWVEFLELDHPSLKARIAAAQAWESEHLRESRKIRSTAGAPHTP